MNQPLRLLQVEDSENDALLIVRMLEKSGYIVDAERVETAAQLRAALQDRPWDAIIADYHLPQFDAPSALAILRETVLDVPFLVVSGAVGEDRAASVMKAGAHDYVMKDNLVRLAPAVAREIEDAQVRRARKLADAALLVARRDAEQGHQLLDAVFTAQLDAIIVCDTTGTVIHTNPAASGILGFEAAGMNVAAVLERLQIAAGPGLSVTAQALAGQHVVMVEHSAADRNFETSASPMRNGAGAIIGAVTIVRDISERKRAQERLEQARKLESIALLAGGIAHDFNNLLTVVAGNLSLALESTCQNCEARLMLPAALESVQRAAFLTRQLLAYAGKGAFIRKKLSVSDAAARAIALLQPSLPGRIELSAQLAPNLPAVLVDPGQMEQVFSNLILNGVESIPEGQPGLVSVRTWFEENAVGIEVADNGCGIERDAQKRIFDPFFTTKLPGRGLGLSAVEGIVRVLDGRIQVESEPGRGTRICIVLPVAGREDAASTPVAAVSTSESGAVLIVDDEPMIRKMASSFLTRRGIPVLEAGSGQEAIDILASDGGAVRVVLLDLAMPGMAGDTALPVMRGMRPDLCVIVSSGFQDRDVQEQFGPDPACRFLPKPYTREQLLAEVLPAIGRAGEAL